MDVAQKPDSKDKKEVAQKPDSKDKTEEVAQSKEERGESSKKRAYQGCPSLNISQASQMENAKKPRVDNIEEKPCVTTNPILPEMQEAEKVATKPHSKDEIEEAAESEVESLESDHDSDTEWWVTRFNNKGDKYPLYDCFDDLNDNDCLDDLSDKDEKEAEHKKRWVKCFKVGVLPGEK